MVALLVLSAIAVLALLVRMAVGGISANDVGLLVTLVSLGAAIVAFLWPEKGEEPARDLADDLAETLREQWLEEARARRLRDPGVLPLSWAATERDGIADDPIRAARMPSGIRVRRRRLSGRLDGRFDDVVRQLAEDYAHLGTGRLVLLGEPGAGKSVLAMLMTLGLLDARETGGVTPVLLSASTWDPLSASLDAWIVNSLAMLYYHGQPETPRRLLLNGLVLPVLDGLDEIPESARRSAVREINRAIGGDRPIIVTCRSAEYVDVIRGGAPVLRGAPVVEVLPLAADDVVAHLSSIAWPEDTDWDDVYGDLLAASGDPSRDHPVAQALSTPLMVSLARFVYERCGGRPDELLNIRRFDSRHRVEDHIIDQVIDGAYGPRHQPAAPPAEPSRWSAQEVRRWLEFLARYLHQHRDRDLAWWTMHRLLPPWTAIGLGIIGGTALAATIASAMYTLTDGSTYLPDTLSAAGAFGFAFALLTIVIWFVAGDRPPSALSVSAKGSLGRLRHGLRSGITIGAVVGGLVVACTAVGMSLGGWTTRELYAFGQLLGMAASFSLVVALALAVHDWLNAPAERSALADPVRFIHEDRRSSLIGAFCAGAAVNLMAFPALLAGGLIGKVLAQAIAGDPEWSAAWTSPNRTTPLAIGLSWDSVGDALSVATAFLLPGTVFAALLLLTRAWPRFVIARSVLAARGQLPWRLIGFLTDAREKGLLRQSSGVYQFRHIRFQERLATQPLELPEAIGAAPRRRAPRRRLTVVGLTGAVLLSMVVISAPRDPAVAVLVSPGERYGPIALSDSAESTAVSTLTGKVQIWSRGPSGFADDPRAERRTGEPARAMALSADGSILAMATTGEVRVMDTYPDDLPDARPPIPLAHPVDEIMLNDDGRIMIFIDTEGELFVYDWSSGGRQRCVTTGSRRKKATVNRWDAIPLWIFDRGDIESIAHRGAPPQYSEEPLEVVVARCADITLFGIRSDDGYTTTYGEIGVGAGGEDPVPTFVISSDYYGEGGMTVARSRRDPLTEGDASRRSVTILDTGGDFAGPDELAISPDAEFVAASRGPVVRLWRIPAGDP
ncbi:hypothetical protein [Actinoplanes sp. NPDC023714]|uniref:NACHT domain-containing protein n=1 Tax=Actinoplanes sp. NPDC023714 TaxID=3154322 RepID=UPI003407FC60